MNTQRVGAQRKDDFPVPVFPTTARFVVLGNEFLVPLNSLDALPLAPAGYSEDSIRGGGSGLFGEAEGCCFITARTPRKDRPRAAILATILSNTSNLITLDRLITFGLFVINT